MRSLLIPTISFFSICFPNVFADDKLISVQTSNGVIQGKRVNYGNNQKKLYYGQADVFLGVPYAEPPIRERRFAPPSDPPQQTTVYDATYFRPQCVQDSPTARNTSEDCLYVNVFCQNAVNYTALSAVMVFIDGANGMSTGGMGEQEMKGTVRNLVSRGVIVVTMQYRLGALGFFSSTSVKQIVPNLGMLDQVKALEWVNREIGSFGGDNTKVTLAGQGDGGCAVSAHTLSPMSQNLFQQAILQSGSIGSCYSPDSNYNGLNANYNVPSNDGQLQYDQGLRYAPLNEGGTVSTTTENSVQSMQVESVQNPSQLLAMQLCNVTTEQWKSGNVGDLKGCLHNYTVDVFTKTDGIHTATWMIVRDNLFLNDSIDNLNRRRPPIPIIIGTVQDEDADYAFKLVANAAASNQTEGDVFNNWFVDFAKRNKVNGTTAQKIKEVIAKNYNVSDVGTQRQYDAPTTTVPTNAYSTPQSTNGPSTTSSSYGHDVYYGGNSNNQQGSTVNPMLQRPQGNVVGNTNGNMPVVTYKDAKGNPNLTAMYHTLEVITKVSSDAGTVSQTATEIDSWVQNGNRYVHVYQFNHVSKIGSESANNMLKNWQPVPKGQDKVFLFMTEDRWNAVPKGQDKVFLFMTEDRWNAAKPTSADKKMADEMGQRWTDFAKNGAVNGWQPVSSSNQQNTQQTAQSSPINYCSLTAQPTMQSGYGQEARTVFNENVKNIIQEANAPNSRQFDQSNQYPSNALAVPRVKVNSQGGGSSWSMSFDLNNFQIGK